MENSSPEIVIVGAGMAGLSAAHRLVTSGLRNITILEAADRFVFYQALPSATKLFFSFDEK